MARSDVIVRDYRRETDFDAVVGLHQELNRVEADLGAMRDARHEAAITCLHEDTRAIRSARGEQLVAIVNDEIVGYVALELSEFGAFVPPPMQAHVHIKNLVVAPTHRRLGIGALFLQRAEELARLHDRRLVTLSFVAGNAIAEAAYTRAGFRPVAIEMAKIIE